MADTKPLFEFGQEIVFAEPAWYQHFDSPYYQPKHRAFRAKVRAFVEKAFKDVDEWEEAVVTEGKEMPLDFIRAAHAEGLYSPMWPVKYGGTPPDGGWDSFMDLIWNDELTRCGSAGPSAAFTIATMALPPIINSGNEYVIDKVVPDLVAGRKLIALCISEPYAGSDVANLRGTAVRDGDDYVINAEKKWITMGVFADYFTVVARTGPKGAKGLSLFLVDRKSPGITVRRMKLQGSWTAGTAMVLFDDVRVPARHMLGEENKGFKLVMHNFNHERFTIAVSSNRISRQLLAASIEYASRRKTFGVTLLQHQVIRQKLADMAMRVEAAHALIEGVAYQMDHGISAARLGGAMALLKVFCTRSCELCVRESAQIFGGAGYVRGGVGQRVERAGRDVRGAVIPGGSDEILADLAVRQAMALTRRYHVEKELEGVDPKQAAKL
jgi:alkylation response protein AidB-like acyl-CoA dehydrogenase